MVEMRPSECPSLAIHKSLGSIPSHNFKSTIVACTGTPYVFLYGGFDEYDALDSNVYLLNTSTMEWEIDNKIDGLYREGHLSVYIGNGNVLVYGGLPFEDEIPTLESRRFSTRQTASTRQDTMNGSTGEIKKDSLMMIYNIFNKKWIGPPDFALENCPSSRSRHACCLSRDGSKLYISGGLVKSTPLNDLYCYDLTLGIWLGPIEFVYRFDHTIMIYEDRIFSFGGLDKDMNHVKSITYYSLKTKTMGEIYLNLDITNVPPTGFYDLAILSSKINPSISLFVKLPLWNYPNNGLSISCFDLGNFEAQNLFSQNNLSHYFTDKNMNDYIWKTAFTNHEGKLYLLGALKRKKRNSHPFGACLNTSSDMNENIMTEDDDEGHEHESDIDGNGRRRDTGGRGRAEEDEDDEDEEQESTRLNYVLQIEMQKFGIPSQLENPLSLDYHRLLLSSAFTDFEIIALLSIEDKDKVEAQLEYQTESIRVHKTVLVARWPHFQRMILTGMNEALENKLFLPEPINRIKALIYYLYVGTIDFDEKYIGELTLVDYSGLLVLTNLYELKELGYLLLQKLFKLFIQFDNNFSDDETSISTLLTIWRDLAFSNESIFIVTVLELIKRKWAIITRSKTFLSLSKEEIVRLCQDSTDDSPLSKSPNHNRSLDTLDTNLIPETPTRNTNSPFVIDSPANHSNLLSTSIFD